tara:strand:+ start:367 stop:531 length:165 start_codon:yes stop_codon:yes gene_type:complete
MQEVGKSFSYIYQCSERGKHTKDSEGFAIEPINRTASFVAVATTRRRNLEILYH